MVQYELLPLPYKDQQDPLKGYISAETLSYHYGKHHKTYVEKLNTLLPGSGFEEFTLEEIIKQSTGKIFNNAAQIWNHTFYWHSLTPHDLAAAYRNEEGAPTDKDLADAINNRWGSFSTFKNEFSQLAVDNFGSGWTWLVKTDKGSLDIVNTSNAGTPLTTTATPLLTCDVWEHAYYIDYRNARPKYLENFWPIVNWEFAANNFSQGVQIEGATRKSS